MGQVSKILSADEVKAKKTFAKAELSKLKGQLREERTELKDARSALRTATSFFGKAERTVIKTRAAITKQEDKVSAFIRPRAS
jgi:hypothetical protein